MYLGKVYGRHCREERELRDIATGSYRNRCPEKAVVEAELGDIAAESYISTCLRKESGKGCRKEGELRDIVAGGWKRLLWRQS